MRTLKLARVCLKKNLKIRKINAMRMPHLLSDKQRRGRVEDANNYCNCVLNILETQNN